MMTIHAFQIDVLARVPEAVFEARVVDFLRDQFENARAAPRRELAPGVREQIARASAHGLVTERQVVAYVVTAWILGVDFDTTFPYLRTVLDAPIDPEQKAEMLSAHTRDYISALQGGK
jgi:hypothetical protein